MVVEKIADNIAYYQCEACKMYYKTKKLVERCEWHCRENRPAILR